MKKYSGFTLVELIVVITILAILGTIGFISLLGYQTSARDSVRISDLNNLRKTIEFTELERGAYPVVTDGTTVTFNSATLWTQGSFGADSQLDSGKISKIPTDPLTGNPYAYSKTQGSAEYQLGAVIEGGSLSYNTKTPSLISQTYAASDTEFSQAYVKGNYNGLFLVHSEVIDSSNKRIYVLGVPSILTSDIVSVDIEDIYANNTFVYSGQRTVPGPYSGNLTTVNTGWGFNPTQTQDGIDNTSQAIVYDTTSQEVASGTGKTELVTNLKSYYSSTGTTGNDLQLKLAAVDLSNSSGTIAFADDIIYAGNEGFAGAGVPDTRTSNISSSGSGGGDTNGAPTSTDFVSIYRMTSDNETLTLPLRSGYNYNFTVDWGDGSPVATVVSDTDTSKSHTYAASGDYTVTISGVMESFGSLISSDPYKDQIISVTDFGDTGLIDLSHAFSYSDNLVGVSGGNMSQVTDMSYMFSRAGNHVGGDMSGWDVSNVLTMERMFFSNGKFIGDISSWEPSEVLSMEYMFTNNYLFDIDINGWDVGKVENMNGTFFNATVFNQDLNTWNTSSVTNMSSMFNTARAFNGNISAWNTSNVLNMSSMFEKTNVFNSDISLWNVEKVTNFGNMFRIASNFDQDISGWKTLAATSMYAMFNYAGAFNQDLSSWIVGTVTSYSSFDASASSWTLAKPNFN